MDDTGVLRRLRVSGIVAITLIAAITLVQAVFLVVLTLSAPHLSGTIDRSGMRRAQTNAILYQAERLHPGAVADATGLYGAIAGLEASQARFKDLSPSQARDYASFLAAARTLAIKPNDALAYANLQALGPLMYRIFNEHTSTYAVAGNRQRQVDRNAILAGSAAILVVAVLTYFLVLAPGALYSQVAIRKLDERRQRFAAVFENSVDAMAVYSPSGTIVNGNPAAIALLGPSAHLVGSHFSRHIAPSERASVAVAFARAADGTPTALKTLFLDADDREIPVLASLAPIRVNGKIVGVVGSARDMSEERRSESALVLERERFRALFEGHPSAVIAIATNGVIERANDAMATLCGFSITELIGRLPTELVPADEVPATLRRFDAAQQGEANAYESILLDKRGRRIEVEVELIPTIVHGALDGIFAIVKDISHERILESRERIQRQRLRAVALLAGAHAQDVASQIAQTLKFAASSLDVDTINVAFVVNGEARVVHGTGSWYQAGRTIAVGKTFSRHVFGTQDILVIEDTESPQWRSDPARAWQPWRQIVALTLFVGGVPAGMIMFAAEHPRVEPFDEADRDFVRVVASLVGASLERERRETELVTLALVDAVTNLPNRAYFTEQLDVALAQARRVGGCVGVHYLDLDGFKAVNDRLGHAAGDRVLALVAERLRSVLRESDMLARIGGDEFAILQSTCQDSEGALYLGRRLIEAVGLPMAIGDGVVQVGASVGIARFPSDSQESTELVEMADKAMYRAKRAGKNTVILHGGPGDISV